jgi:hypothetical protein
MSEKQSKKKRILKNLANVGIAILSLSLMTSPASAVDPTEAAGHVW